MALNALFSGLSAQPSGEIWMENNQFKKYYYFCAVKI
jgi:hypothetical protein